MRRCPAAHRRILLGAQRSRSHAPIDVAFSNSLRGVRILGSFTHVNILFVAEQARVRTLAIRHYGGARTPAVAGESAT